MRNAPLIALAALLLSGAAAQAQPLVLTPVPAKAGKPALDLTIGRARGMSSFAEVSALRAAGMAKTSLDRRFAGDDATASVGFLCGLQPSQDRSGGGTARGEDPHGRFLGAKLSRAF